MSSEDKMSIIRRRIRERMDALDTNPREVANRAGLGKNIVYNILNPKSPAGRNPSIATLEAIADALECDFDHLTGKQIKPRGKSSKRAISTIPIAGVVGAGVFDEMSGAEPWLEEHMLERVEAPRSVQYPRARHFAFRVVGDSMNNARPRPILAGELALFVDVIDTKKPVINGKIYLVRRTENAGQSYEWTIKRARVTPKTIELVPESTNPIHKPYVYRNGDEPEDGVEVRAVGLLYAMHYSFE